MRFIFNKLIRFDRIFKDKMMGFYNINEKESIKMNK